MEFTLADLWGHMGVPARLVVITMLLMSLASAIVVLERLWVLSKSNRQSIAFAQYMSTVLATGDLSKAVGSESAPDAGHLGRVLQAALRVYGSAQGADPDVTFDSVARALERQGQRELHAMKRGIGVLSTVASTAPFVGLLGTVVGIVNAFSSMAVSGSTGLATISAGIAEALTTTALGLLVAIPAVAAYNGMAAWIDARGVDISEASNELLDLVAHELRKKGSSAESSLTFRTRPVSVVRQEA
jgi:biopolymer transport protein ExbB/biopolymer transport protein TolQ